MKEKLDSLQELIEDRNRQVKELWNVIQMLDDENMMLKSHSDKWEKREKLLIKDIINLKVSAANANRSADITVSYNAADWKEVLDKELITWGTQNLKAQRKRDISSNKRCRRWSQ